MIQAAPWVAASNGVVVTTSSWRAGAAGLVAPLAGVVMFLVLVGLAVVGGLILFIIPASGSGSACR